MSRVASIAAVAGVAVTLAAGSGAGAATSPWLPPPATFATGRLDSLGFHRLAAMRWRTLRASDAPTIRVSPAYADADAIARRWAAFFPTLVHGSELAALDAYVAPLEEVQALCGSPDVLGCYGANRMVIPDQVPGSISAASIATHEYGHHVAFNRVNPPWRAVDWGTKRWATHEQVCGRAATGTAYPGAEDGNYPLNPGEAFAETYRVLNETALGFPTTWPIVDPSFRPDAAALDAVRADVTTPWAKPVVTARRVRFAGRARTWTVRVASPLDGTLSAQVQPGSADLTLVSADGGAPLEQGAWVSSGAKALEHPVCGERTFVLRLTRRTQARRFTLRLTVP
jgi:hypothetical protein